MDIVAAYQLVGSYRGAAEICGTTHKTVKRVIERTAVTETGRARPVRAPRPSNYEVVRTVVTGAVAAGKGRVSAKRLLPRARAAGYAGSGPQLPAPGRAGETPLPARQRPCPTSGGVGSG